MYNKGGVRMPGSHSRDRKVFAYELEDLAAGADISARPIFALPTNGGEILAARFLPQGASAGVDNSNTAVIALKDGDGNTIVSKTYNTATQPPASGVTGDLGTISTTHGILTAWEVVTLSVTQGATADLPSGMILIEYVTYEG